MFKNVKIFNLYARTNEIDFIREKNGQQSSWERGVHAKVSSSSKRIKTSPDRNQTSTPTSFPISIQQNSTKHGEISINIMQTGEYVKADFIPHPNKKLIIDMTHLKNKVGVNIANNDDTIIISFTLPDDEEQLRIIDKFLTNKDNMTTEEMEKINQILNEL